MQFPVLASLRLATVLPSSSSLLCSRETCGHLDTQPKGHSVWISTVRAHTQSPVVAQQLSNDRQEI